MAKRAVLDRLGQMKLGGYGLVLHQPQRSDWHGNVYLFPMDEEKLVTDLFELSLGNAITEISDAMPYIVRLRRSDNGKTNIDAEVVEAFLEATKRRFK